MTQNNVMQIITSCKQKF